MSAKAGKRWPAASGEAIEPERLLPQLHAADPEDEATQAVLLISGMGPAYSTERRTASPPNGDWHTIRAHLWPSHPNGRFIAYSDEDHDQLARSRGEPSASEKWPSPQFTPRRRLAPTKIVLPANSTI